MRLLLDTHAFIWAMGMVNRLPSRTADAIRDPENEIWLSAASLYEIEYKRGRNTVLDRLPPDLVAAALGLPASLLEITPEHAIQAARLDRTHKDPWDRLIAAQASVEGLTIVTRDRAIAALGVPVLW